MNCRFCDDKLNQVVIDLGMSPLCESYVCEEDLHKVEHFYPLIVYVCNKCRLVQLDEFVPPKNIFIEYAYFSSYSDSWVEHALAYTEKVIERFNLDKNSFVVELASNDGYLLQHFVNRSVPVLGIEPAVNVAKAAEEKNVPTVTEFFNDDFASKLKADNKQADLVIGNNVLAQVPDLNSFVKGMQILLKPDGVITLEFPHLLKLMKENQFDTIYHEHFSYFSAISIKKIMEYHGLRIFDVENLSTHGGSLRVYACHENSMAHETSDELDKLIKEEIEYGLDTDEGYHRFTEQIIKTKRDLLKVLIELKEKGKTIAGYGAPGKGNTLLNYCGIREDFLQYTVDRNPYKQGRYLPGTHIPILHPDKIKETKPDYVMILPWNFKDEIMNQISFIKEWGGKFIIPIPKVEIVE